MEVGQTGKESGTWEVRQHYMYMYMHNVGDKMEVGYLTT